jgi:hypothetical protein
VIDQTLADKAFDPEAIRVISLEDKAGTTETRLTTMDRDFPDGTSTSMSATSSGSFENM